MAITVSVLSGGGGHHHGGHHGGGHRGGGGYRHSYGPSYYSNEIFVEPTSYYMTGVVDGSSVTWVAPVADYTGAYYTGNKKPTNIILLRAI